MKPGGMVMLLALLAGWTGPAHAQSQEPAKDQPPADVAKRPAVIRAQLSVGKEDAYCNVELVGRKGNDIYYRIPSANLMDGYVTIHLNRIVKARFEFQYDEYEVFKCSNERRWADAANVIIKAVAPAIPFLDFSTNNAVKPALEAAGYLFKAGMACQQADGEINNKQADAAYAQAYKIFQQAGAPQWFEGAGAAQLKAIQCLVMMGKLDSAADQFSKLSVCEDIYDNDYGLYWLVQANILYKQKNYREALEAAVKSLVFKNKDMETFPDALLLAAHCYYELQEMYRARDVYYEIVRLFDSTDWSAVARKQLAIIMKNNLTKNKEVANYWKTFIDVKEDMNKRVEEYLKATEKESVTNTTAAAAPNEGIKTP